MYKKIKCINVEEINQIFYLSDVEKLTVKCERVLLESKFGIKSAEVIFYNGSLYIYDENHCVLSAVYKIVEVSKVGDSTLTINGYFY